MAQQAPRGVLWRAANTRIAPKGAEGSKPSAFRCGGVKLCSSGSVNGCDVRMPTIIWMPCMHAHVCLFVYTHTRTHTHTHTITHTQTRSAALRIPTTQRQDWNLVRLKTVFMKWWVTQVAHPPPGSSHSTSAPGLGSPLPHLHRDWARPALPAAPAGSGGAAPHALPRDAAPLSGPCGLSSQSRKHRRTL